MEFATFPIKIESVKLELYYYFHVIGKLSIINSTYKFTGPEYEVDLILC